MHSFSVYRLRRRFPTLPALSIGDRVYIFLLDTNFRVCSPAGPVRVVATTVKTPPSRLKTSFDSSAIGPVGVNPRSLRVVITNFGPSQETRDLDRKTSPSTFVLSPASSL